MFKKPFKLKLQVQLKSTEKKRLCSDLKTFFPALSDEDIAALISNKESIFRTKITTFKDEDVEIYSINKVPMYFEIMDTKIKLPTIFLLWQFPHMLPTFTTNSTVLKELKNGADLFFPGVYTECLAYSKLDYKKNDPLCLNLVDNKAAVAVGLSLVDQNDVIDANKHRGLGKVLKIYHIAGDYLFKMNEDAVVPQLGPPDWALPDKDNPEENIDSQNQTSDESPIVESVIEEISSLKIEDSTDIVEVNNPEAEKEKNSELLEYCFLKGLKSIPKGSYPILPATFYANYVLTSVPEGQNLNIKKTKWKKFSTFLNEKSIEGIIRLQQLPKNDFTIAEANTDHKRVKEFVDPYKRILVEVDSKTNKLVVKQVFSVTAATLPFFTKFGFKKHDELTRNDVRNHLNDYIKSESLVHPENPEMVVLDAILYGILKGDEVISRGNLLAGMLDKMRVQHQVSNCGNADAITHKGKMPLIEFEICLRSGNKKVTLISNLECYGVNVNSFSKELQHKAAASTTITPHVPGKKGPQIQVQGNQIAVTLGILKEKYNINEKFMKGLEKAVKSKSKK